MFERLVITNSETKDTGRKWYFLFTSVTLSAVLVAGLIFSLFSEELSLGNGDFEQVRLMMPVVEPITEPEAPLPEELREPPVEQEQVEAKATTQNVKIDRPTRQVNMARLNETPPDIPDSVSTRPNTQAARPENRYFDIGKLDRDVASVRPSGTSMRGGGSSGDGRGLSVSNKTVAAVKESEPPPPPPPVVKKSPAVAKRIVSMGVINGKAKVLPVPVYPSAARAIRAKGTVNVKVLINEGGRVISADAVSGHPLLRNAAEDAARRAQFSPTLLSGVPVKTSGVIVYNFVG